MPSLFEKGIKNRRPSWKRKYYVKMNEKYIKCKICHGKLKFNLSNHGNIGRHLKLKHSDIYYKEKNKNVSNRVACSNPAYQTTDKGIKKILYSDEIHETVTKSTNNKVQDSKTHKFKVDKSADVAEATQASALKEEKVFLSEKTDTEKRVNTRNDRTKRSWTRKYYHKINDKLLKCRICNRLLNMNIHRHIRTKHPDIYTTENPQTQETDVEIELWIKNICAQSTMDMSARSCFWNFFEVVEQDKLYKCSFCRKTIAVFPKNVHNLKRHVYNVHRKQHDMIIKYGGFKRSGYCGRRKRDKSFRCHKCGNSIREYGRRQ